MISAREGIPVDRQRIIVGGGRELPDDSTLQDARDRLGESFEQLDLVLKRGALTKEELMAELSDIPAKREALNRHEAEIMRLLQEMPE